MGIYKRPYRGSIGSGYIKCLKCPNVTSRNQPVCVHCKRKEDQQKVKG